MKNPRVVLTALHFCCFANGVQELNSYKVFTSSVDRYGGSSSDSERRDSSHGVKLDSHDFLSEFLRFGHLRRVDFQPNATLPAKPAGPSISMWADAYYTDVCQKRRELETAADYFVYCEPRAEVVWSPKMKLAYLKTPRAASNAFISYFLSRFPDTVHSNLQDITLPNDTYVFTFVRNPIYHRLAAFNHIDGTLDELFHDSKEELPTFFQEVPRWLDGGRARFRAFLWDVQLQRFGGKFAPALAATQLAGMFGHRSSEPLSHVGRMENLQADWEHIQVQAGVPQMLRTTAVIEDAEVIDWHHSLDQLTVQRLCEVYISDFVCLGYEMPKPCQGRGYEVRNNFLVNSAA